MTYNSHLPAIKGASSSFLNEPIVGRFTLKKMLAVLVALMALYFAWKFFLKKSEKEKAAEKAAEAINGLAIEETNLSLSQGDINLIAQELYSAMKGVGTDEDAIISLFNRISTKDDLLAVMKRFGTPEYGSWWLGHKYLDLTGWLKEELSGDTLNSVRNVFLNYGIPF
ncbi:MAG: annexin [Prevotellaceae bacterium]|jgi:hypothetical protein|nr:annexin [Prevotellaceae bacterium]